jgi:serine phosphatase RsbU (regulator of sigma subunit)
MDSVLVTTPQGRSSRHEIGSGALRIGRSRTNDIILEDQHVSRQHAEIARHPEGCYLVDVGAKSGVRLNGAVLEEPALLHPGDTIEIGHATLIFESDASATVVFADLPAAADAGMVVLPPRTPGAESADSLRATATLGPAAVDRVPLPGEGGDVSSPLGLFARADRELQAPRPLSEIFEKIMDLAGMAVPFERGALMLREADHWVQSCVRSEGAGREPIPISRTLADRVLNQRQSILTTDALADDRFKEGMSVMAQGIRSAMCVPLWNDREVIGMIYVDSRRHADLFTAENLQVLAHLASIAAVKIENCRLFEKMVLAQAMERDVRRAAEIQRHLLPAGDPILPGYELHGRSLPCHAVGGDYFEYLSLAGGRLGIAVGDVSGKGFPAALLMCSFQASLVALAESGLGPLEVVEQLNEVLSRRFPESRFVTLFYGVLDPERHELTYVNAGHCPPWLLGGGEPRRLGHTGRPVGLFEGGSYTAATTALLPGDTLVCFTDGISSARSPGGEPYGEERILGIVGKERERPTTEMADAMLAEVEGFIAGKPREDDFTVLILRRRP